MEHFYFISKCVFCGLVGAGTEKMKIVFMGSEIRFLFVFLFCLYYLFVRFIYFLSCFWIHNFHVEYLDN